MYTLKDLKHARFYRAENAAIEACKGVYAASFQGVTSAGIKRRYRRLVNTLNAVQEKNESKYAAVTEFVEGIPDDQIRQAIKLYCFKDEELGAIYYKLWGGYSECESAYVYKTMVRYLEKYQS